MKVVTNNSKATHENDPKVEGNEVDPLKKFLKSDLRSYSSCCINTIGSVLPFSKGANVTLWGMFA
jgi:hypothetical protein